MREKILERIIEKQKEYIALLHEELDEVVPIADARGWRSHRYDRGIKLRNDLAALGYELAAATKLSEAVDREMSLAAEKEVSDPNLCCICHRNYVDSADGFDTCQSCLKNI